MPLRLIGVGLVVLTQLLFVPPAAAECILLNARVLEDPYRDVVFSGTVTLIERTSDHSYRATIAVHRVWKGRVERQATVDVNERLPETPRLQNNVQYLLAAKRRDQADPAVQTGAAALWLPTCSDMAYEEAVKRGLIHQLGGGLPPSD